MFLKEPFNLEGKPKIGIRNQLWETFKLLWERPIGTFTNISTHMRLVLEELKETMKSVNSAENALEANDRIERNIQKFIDVTDRLQKSLDRFESNRYRL